MVSAKYEKGYLSTPKKNRRPVGKENCRKCLENLMSTKRNLSFHQSRKHYYKKGITCLSHIRKKS